MFSDVFRFGPCLFCQALRSLSFVSFVFSLSVTSFLCIPCAALLLRELAAAMLQLPHIFLLLRRVHSSVAEASDVNFAASSKKTFLQLLEVCPKILETRLCLSDVHRVPLRVYFFSSPSGESLSLLRSGNVQQLICGRFPCVSCHLPQLECSILCFSCQSTRRPTVSTFTCASDGHLFVWSFYECRVERHMILDNQPRLFDSSSAYFPTTTVSGPSPGANCALKFTRNDSCTILCRRVSLCMCTYFRIDCPCTPCKVKHTRASKHFLCWYLNTVVIISFDDKA